MINPRSVAVIGASSDPTKFGGRVMQFLVKHGYGGRILPINPKGESVLGISAFRSIAEVDDGVDVALVAVPATSLPRALEECGTAGVLCCVVITADFAELGEEGAARESELVSIARRHGMRLIGPNCLGFVNPHRNLALTSSVALAVEPLPKGTIGLVCQSGSMMASMISHAVDFGIGFSACISVGNQADLEICDFIEYFLADETTRSICLYVEGLRDGARFLELAERCRAAGKPLLAVKAGRSEAGAQIARSHTASLAGSHAVWEAVCRDRGIIAVDDPEAMIHCAFFLERFGAARCSGIAALSPSGGTVAVTADRIVTAGLELAELAPETRAALTRIVPPSRLLNPLDVGGLARDRGISAAEDAQALLSADPNVGVVFIVVATTPQLDTKAKRWGEAALAGGKPTAILFTPGSLVNGARKALREIGCPYTDRMDDALRVMRASIEYGRFATTARDITRAPSFTQMLHAKASELTPGFLTEPEAKNLLQLAGIATTRHTLATSAGDAVAGADAIGYPVVLKGVARALIHKSDVGAVKLGLQDAAAVRKAWDDIADAMRTHMPGAAFDGVLVQEMVSGGVEVIAGAKWDPQFGAVIMAGAGGILVEIMHDVALALAPLSHDRARKMLEGLQVWPLLTGARGRPPCDIDALTDAMERVAWIAHTLGPQLVELDINPLLVKERGVIALDARATLTAAQAKEQ